MHCYKSVMMAAHHVLNSTSSWDQDSSCTKKDRLQSSYTYLVNGSYRQLRSVAQWLSFQDPCKGLFQSALLCW